MKGRVILIDLDDDGASQAALVVDGKLEDLLIDPPMEDVTPRPGEIYWAKVDRPAPNIGGVFVNLGHGSQGFLRGAKGAKAGTGVLVQVSSDAEPGKAVPVTTQILYKGRLVILTPDAPGVNVSRQIRSEEDRDRLQSWVRDVLEEQQRCSEPEEAYLFESPGLIVRSAALHATRQEIAEDLRQTLSERYSTERVPKIEGVALPQIACLVRSRDIALREWEGEVREEAGVFDHFGVWDEIERLRSPRADLPSGGWMAIEATRAMVTVDVNTGDRFSTGAAMTANIEAARELPRQLRLRGLGGQVIVDFAPLKKMHRKKIEETLKAGFRRDAVPTTLAGWTPLGNFEMQRKRERRPLDELF